MFYASAGYIYIYIYIFAVTLRGLYDTLTFPEGCCEATFSLFPSLRSCLRVIWLKSIAGSWTTSDRMDELHTLGCVFGCDTNIDVGSCSIEPGDNIKHYLFCPALWAMAGEALHVVPPLSIAERLCMASPCIVSFELLAFSYCMYHSTKNDPHCVAMNRSRSSRGELHLRCAGFSRDIVHLIRPGRDVDLSWTPGQLPFSSSSELEMM